MAYGTIEALRMIDETFAVKSVDPTTVGAEHVEHVSGVKVLVYDTEQTYVYLYFSPNFLQNISHFELNP